MASLAMIVVLQGSRVPERVGQALNAPLFSIGNTPVTPATLVAFGIVIFFTWVASLVLQRATVRGMSARSKADPATLQVTSRLVNYVVLFIGFSIALQTIGISVTGLFAAGAFFAIAIGFAMQNVAQNFVSGVILMTERTIKPGDILKVEDQVVRVTRLGLRSTVARSRDEEDLIVPNSVLVQNTVTNYTLRDSTIRVRAAVGVSYNSDVALVMKILHDAAAALPDRVKEYEPIVLLTGFGESSINFEVSAWVTEPWLSRRILSELNQAIWWALKDNGVVIPFPQRDVHLMPVAGDTA